jgi:AcrR family transcriptional regulator
MIKTKQRILNVSKDLFNEHGYSQVTIRMIALKLKMSSGNLNYHFKKREEILEALYFEMVTEFDQRIKELPQIEISLKRIKDSIHSSMERMIDYRFIWTDLFNILKSNETISAHFSTVYKVRIEGTLFVFNQLNEIGLMRSASFENEYEMLAERMVVFGNTWIYNSQLYDRKSTKQQLKDQVNSMLAIFYPYLTAKGLKEFDEVTSITIN